MTKNYQRPFSEHCGNFSFDHDRGGSRGRAIGAIVSLKPTKAALFMVTWYNSENSIRDLKTILSSIVLSQQCCEVHFISLTVET